MSENRYGKWGTQTQERSNGINQKAQFVVSERGIHPDVLKEVMTRDNSTCRGVDDKNDLAICVFEIIGIGGERKPASVALGFSIDRSHYSHNQNSNIYFSAEGMRCQCKWCHLAYSNGIGHFSSARKVAKHPTYSDQARGWKNRDKYNAIDTSLVYPKDVTNALGQVLVNYGVVWEYNDREGRLFPVVPENWMGPATRDQIVDLTHRIYVPKPVDILGWVLKNNSNALGQ